MKRVSHRAMPEHFSEAFRPRTTDHTHLQFPTLDRHLRDYCTAHNMIHIPHDGRHTCATNLKKAGVDDLTIQKILGHAPLTITGKVYIHMDVKQLLDAVNKLPKFNSQIIEI